MGKDRAMRQNGGRVMQLGMPTLIENRTLENNVALCAGLGLNFIELNMNFPEYQVARLEQADQLLRLAEGAGIYYTIHLDENLNVADFNPLVAEAYLETVRRTVAVAQRLLPLRDRFGDSAQPLTVNMHMHHGIHITLPDRKVQMYDRDFDTYLASFARFRDLCEGWIGDSLLESPVFGLTWDIGHSKATGERDVPFLLAHEDRLIHFHIHDGTETPPRNHLALGDGEIDLPARLSLARRLGARCVLETKTIEALKRSVAWLKTRQ